MQAAGKAQSIAACEPRCASFRLRVRPGQSSVGLQLWLHRRWILLIMLRANDREVCWSVGMNAEIPHVAVHSLRSQHFGKRVLTGFKWSFRSDLDPAFSKLLVSSCDCVLLLRNFAVNSSLDLAHNAVIALRPHAHNMETVPGKLSGGLFAGLRFFAGLCCLRGRCRLLLFVHRLEIDVDRGQRGMYL